MTLSIPLSQNLEAKLIKKAKQRKMRPEQLAHDLLELALGETELDLPSMEELIHQIQSLPKNSSLVSMPKASLADALKSGPIDPDFDLEEWEAEWAKAEKELEQLNLNSK